VCLDHPRLARRLLLAAGFDRFSERLDGEIADNVDGEGDGSARASAMGCDVAADPVAPIVSPNETTSSLT
jgi:hypothetical protein